MALLDLEQKESVPQKLLLNSLPAVNASVLSVVEQTIEPKIPIDNKLRTFEYEFHSTSDYVDCRNIRLRLELTIKKVTEEDKIEDIVVGDKCSLINNTFFSMFSEIETFLNHKLVSINDHTFAYKSFFKTLMKYDRQTCIMKLPGLINWYHDTARYHEDFGKLPKGGMLNAGFTNRRASILTQGKLVMESKLDCLDIASLDRYLPSGVRLLIRFHRASDEFVLLVDPKEKTRFVVHILKGVLKLPVIKISDAMALTHAQILKQQSFKMPIMRSESRITTLTKGQTVFIHSNIFQTVPIRLIITFCSTTSFVGSTSSNPFRFQHYNIRTISVKQGTELVSPSPINFDFSKKEFFDGYLTCYNYCNSIDTNRVFPITKEEYENGYFMVIFEMNNYPSTQLGDNLINKKNVELYLQFSEPLEEPIMCIVLSESCRLLEITEDRTVKYHDI